MRRVLPVIAVLLTACSPGDANGTTVASLSTTSQSPPPSVVPTTVISTTSVPLGTTSTSVEPTTTTLELSGNWAEFPLVVTGFGALGWWNGTTWVSAEVAGELPVVGGEDYQVAAIGLQATTTGGSQATVCEPLFNIGVELENDYLLGEWPGPYGVAISAPWDLYPNLVEEFEDDGTYSAIAAELLADRGLVVAEPVVKQLFRTDLEGDGTNEILVVAEHLSGGYLPEAGDYSIVFLQKVVDGAVRTIFIDGSVILDPEDAFVVGFAIGSVADLNGDAQMEIIVDAAYFEGLGVELWEYVDDDIGLFKYLEMGCGS
jgi:hypothetical protein